MIRDRALKEVVPVVIAYNFKLKHAVEVGAQTSSSSLLYADAEFLKENYVSHWGGWVAGVELPVSSFDSSFSKSLPGVYTVESDFPATIDEKIYVSGETIAMDSGVKNIVSIHSQVVVLRWRDNLYKPSYMPSERRVFSRF